MRQRSLASILQGKDLQLGYLKNGKRREVLAHLDFELFTGEMTCLLGPNGVGKSTLVKAIMAQLQPWQGSLNLDGQAISSYSQERLARKMAVVLTEPVFPGNMTVGELVALGRTPYTGWSGRLSLEDQKEVEKAIALTNIVYLKSERLSEISDGQRQKAMIARAIAQNGDLIILDEPTAHLDLVNRFEIMDLLREIALEENKGVLVVTHDLEIAIETADRFWLLTCGNPL
ncbi:MAG: ABC transporter ATP-binding protein, partial [Cytophagales bacterium]